MLLIFVSLGRPTQSNPPGPTRTAMTGTVHAPMAETVRSVVQSLVGCHGTEI